MTHFVDETLRVIVHGNHGVEIEPLVPDAKNRHVHLGQACAPLRCWCETVHQPTECFDLVLHIGPNPPSMGSGTLTFAFVPTEDVERPYAIVTSSASRGRFLPAAADLVDHLVDPLLIGGAIGYELEDLRKLFGGARRLRFLKQLADQPAPRAGDSLLCVVGSPELTLFEVNEIATRYADVCDESIVFTSLIDEAHEGGVVTSVLYAFVGDRPR